MKSSGRRLRRLMIGLLVLAIALGGGLYYCKKKKLNSEKLPEILESRLKEDDGNLHAYFLDVGQGSAALIRLNGKYMLIDAGGTKSADVLIEKLKELYVLQLDYIILTDMGEEHLGGAARVLEEYAVGHILAPNCTADTDAYRAYAEAVQENKVEVLHPNLGETYSFGNAFFTVVGPAGISGVRNARTASLCIRLDYGDTDFLFCGDLSGEDEEALVEALKREPNADLKADVYVVNDHGSGASTTETFLGSVRPRYAVLSCGADEAPDAGTLERLSAREAELFRTDLQGTVEAISDGSVISWKPAPYTNY